MTRGVKYLSVSLCALAFLAAVALIAGYIGLRMVIFPSDLSKSRYEMEDINHLYHSYPYAAQWLDEIVEDGSLRDTLIVVDGKKMHAFYLPASYPTTRTAFIIHGWTSNATGVMHLGYMYHCDLDYNIFLPDLNGHGRSEGAGAQMGWKDCADCLSLMDAANQIFSLKDKSGKTEETEMVVHGVSMGASTVMNISGETPKSYVKAYVEDCGYTSVWDEIIWNQRNNPLRRPLAEMASWWCGKLYGWDFREASSLRQVEKCTLPMLFIHGEEDTFVPTEMVHRLYEAKKGDKELFLAQGSAHENAYRDHPSEYTDVVRDFLDAYIP